MQYEEWVIKHQNLYKKTSPSKQIYFNNKLVKKTLVFDMDETLVRA